MKWLSRWRARSAPPVAEAPVEIQVVPAEPSVDDEVSLREALGRGDTQEMARLAIEAASTKVRQLAAQSVDDPAQIRRLLKAAGGRDKNVYKILRQKEDARLAGERAARQEREEIEALHAAILRHASRPYDPLFAPALEQLEARWQLKSAAAPEAVRTGILEALERCHATVARHIAIEQAEAARAVQEAQALAEDQRQRALAQEMARFAAEETAAAEAARRKAWQERLAAEALALRQLAGLIGKASDAVRHGASGRAAGLRRAIEEKMTNAPPLPAHLVRQLQHLDAQLSELKDWKSYAASPKRAQLIEEMEALVGATLAPQELAQEIKRLQSAWKTVSRGVAEDTDADWQRFHQAAETAYQPCKAYFSEQALRRQENLGRRAALLQRLESFEAGQNWEQADWRLVATVLREARQEWRVHVPVDRAAGKAVEETFQAAIGRLQQRLEEEWARNARLKKALIARAERLLCAPDSRKAVEEVRQIQLKWKSVGNVLRDEDRKLWEEFRGHCDAAFQRRDREHAARIDELKAQKAEETALRRELEEAAKEYAVGSGEEGGKFGQLQSAFEGLRK